MTTTQRYCDQVKKKLGIESDYALAKALDVHKQTISNYSNGHRAFDNTMAAKIATILGISVIKVIADLELERGSNNEIWKRIRAAAAVTIAIGAGTVATLAVDPEAATYLASALPLALSPQGLGIMLN